MMFTLNLFRAVREQQLHFSIFWETWIWKLTNSFRQLDSSSWHTEHISMCASHLQADKGSKVIFTEDGRGGIYQLHIKMDTAAEWRLTVADTIAGSESSLL